MDSDPEDSDPDPPGSFAGHLVRTLTGGALTMLIGMGCAPGWRKGRPCSTSAAGPGTRSPWPPGRSPQDMLHRVRAALAPGGLFVMVDTKFSSDLAGNVGHPLAALCYALSLMYCTPVGLVGGGAGLGAMWGTERAGQMLATAGSGQVEVLDSPRPQNCIFVCRPG